MLGFRQNHLRGPPFGAPSGLKRPNNGVCLHEVQKTKFLNKDLHSIRLIPLLLTPVTEGGREEFAPPKKHDANLIRTNSRPVGLIYAISHIHMLAAGETRLPYLRQERTHCPLRNYSIYIGVHRTSCFGSSLFEFIAFRVRYKLFLPAPPTPVSTVVR